MNKKTRIGIISGGAIVLTILYIIAGYAMASEWPELYFDEDGRVSFENTDNAAVNIAYKTIGWTIKRYNLPIDDERNQTIVCRIDEEEYMDENGLKHSIYYVDKNTIINIISEQWEEWANQLNSYGGAVYMDSIDTIREYGEYLGGLDENNNSWGEVYYDYEGISNARWWRRPEDLKQYFNRKLIITPNDQTYEEPYGEDYEKQLVLSYNYDNDNDCIRVDNKASLISSEFDVRVAIPGNAKVDLINELDTTAYTLSLCRHYGYRYYPVKVHINRDLVWYEDFNECRQSIEYTRVYYVRRDYEYYTYVDSKLYGLRRFSAESDAFGFVSEYTEQWPMLNVDSKAYIRDLEYNIDMYIRAEDIISDSGVCPTVYEEDYYELASNSMGQVETGSDDITINNKKILDASGNISSYEENKTKLLRSGINLRKTAPDGLYSVYGECIYVLYDTNEIIHMPVSMNKINIFTPISNDLLLGDLYQYNQLENPYNNLASAILGKGMEIICRKGVAVGNYKYKGYNQRVEESLIQERKLMFECDVILDNKRVAAGTWIDFINIREVMIPCDIKEGNYDVFSYTKTFNGKMASDIQRFNVSGQILGYNVSIEGKNTYTWELPWQNSDNLKTVINPEFDYSVVFVGDKDNARICPVISIRYEDMSGNVVPVGLYERSGTGENYSYIPYNYKNNNEKDMKLIENVAPGISVWKGRFILPDNIYVLKEDTQFDDSIHVTEGKLIVNMDIYVYYGENLYMTYSNRNNCQYGFCNMWNTENYDNSRFIDGDVFVYDLSYKKTEEQLHRIYGTH